MVAKETSTVAVTVHDVVIYIFNEDMCVGTILI